MTSQNRQRDQIEDGVDLRPILAASQIIASELSLERLLNRILSIVMEISGAELSFLVLKRDEEWATVAFHNAGQVQSPATDGITSNGDELPAASVIQFVARTRESVNLADAVNSGKFIDDPTIQRRGVRSLLCIPLVNQGIIAGILYVENNVSTRAFSLQHQEALQLLSSQMAVSIENARLYQQSQKMLSEPALSNSLEQIISLLEFSPLSVAVTTFEGRFLTANKSFVEHHSDKNPR